MLLRHRQLLEITTRRNKTDYFKVQRESRVDRVARKKDELCLV